MRLSVGLGPSFRRSVMCLFIQVVNNFIKDFIKGLRKEPKKKKGQKLSNQPTHHLTMTDERFRRINGGQAARRG